MVINRDGLDEFVRIALSTLGMAAAALQNRPAEVQSARRFSCDDEHRFVAVLADIGEVELARNSIEGVPPRVAEPARPDFQSWGIRVQAQHFPEQRRGVLRAGLFGTGASPIAHPDPE